MSLSSVPPLPPEIPQTYGAEAMLNFIRMGTCEQYPSCDNAGHYFCKQALPAENTWNEMVERSEALENAWDDFVNYRGKMYMDSDAFYMAMMEVELRHSFLGKH